MYYLSRYQYYKQSGLLRLLIIDLCARFSQKEYPLVDLQNILNDITTIEHILSQTPKFKPKSVGFKNDEDFDKIKVNTLIITGELDMGSTIEMAKELNQIINNSKLKIIENGKHLCSIECADEVNLTIKNFLDINEQT